MRFPAPLSLCFALVFAATSSSLRAVDLPKEGPLTRVVRATDSPADGAIARKVSGAVDGRALYQPADYKPLLHASLPDEGDPLSVWVRYRGLALQMKSVAEDGAQHEFPWNWSRQDEGFGWRLVGTYSRAALGQKILFIHAPNPPAHAGLDAVVITGDPSVRPNGSAPLPGMPNAEDAAVSASRPPAPESDEPGAATVSIDWTRTEDPVAPMVYSLNSFVAFNPARAASPEWQAGMAYMGSRLVRLHHANLTTDSAKNWPGWWDTSKNAWDYPKIRAALAAWSPPAGTQRLFSFSSWLPGMDENKDNRLDDGKLDAYAAAAADLVRFMNIECRAGIEYFEITNEKDGPYWVAPSRKNQDYTDDLVALYNTVADAVRSVDPSIKIGGPAAMRPDFYENLRRFVRGTRDRLEFVSIHAYASGRNDEPDQSIYDKVETMAKHSRELVKIVREEIPDRAVEVHLNEYNIAWTWETREPRMVNHKGAVFDALALARFARVDGLTAANAWNDQDGVYGKMDADGSFRPAAHVFHLFNAHHQGVLAHASSSAAERVVAHATRDGERPALTLINRTNGVQTVTLATAGTPDDTRWNHARIDATGHHLHSGEPVALPAQIELPPHSVTTWWSTR